MTLVKDGDEVYEPVDRDDDEEGRKHNDEYFVAVSGEKREFGNGREGCISLEVSFPQSKDHEKDDREDK